MYRNLSIDVLKLSLACMIVGLHSGFLGEFSDLWQWLTVTGLFRIAVPIFLIINGYYFYDNLTNNTWREWLNRIFILYFVWMAIYSPLWYPINQDDVNFDFMKLINTYLFGYYHLWYLSGMIGAAIILLFVKDISVYYSLFLTFVLFAIGVSIQYLGNYHYFEGGVLDIILNKHHVHRNALFLSFPFMFIGYYIRKNRLQDKFSLKAVLLFLMIGFITLISESYFNYINPDREGGFDNFASLIIICPAFFMLFLKLDIKGKSKSLALYSSSIYLIHILIMWMLYDIFELGGTFLTVATILLSALISYLIIKINAKVKFLL